MGAFLRILLTVVLFFYAISILIKLIFRRKMRKLEKQMNQYAQEETKSSTNEVKKPHVDPNIGEYTDYEEIR